MSDQAEQWDFLGNPWDGNRVFCLVIHANCALYNLTWKPQVSTKVERHLVLPEVPLCQAH